MGQPTVNDYLSYTPAGGVYKACHSSGSQATNPSNPRDLEGVQFSTWESFVETVHEQRNIALNSKSENMLLPLIEKELTQFKCQNESQVEIALMNGLFNPLRRLMVYLGFPGEFTLKPTEVILDPDYSWESQTRSPIDTILIEVKTFWAFNPPEDLVPILKSGTSSSQEQVEMSGPAAKRSKKDDPGDPGDMGKKCMLIVQQIYGYMSVNHLRYGVLATFEKFFFLRRTTIAEVSTPMLEITKVIKRDQTRAADGFTVMEAWLSLIMIAEQDYLFTSPYPSPIVKQRTLHTKNHFELVESARLGNLYFAERITLDELGDLRGHSKGTKIRGQLGVIVDGGIYGLDEENSVMKIVDTSKSPDKRGKLNLEISVYKALESLQGKIVPKFHGVLQIYNWIMVLVLSRCGKQINRDQFVARYGEIQDMLKKIHAAGVVHGDLELRNILIKEEKLTIIDFSEANLRSSSTEEEFSNDCKKDLESLKCLLEMSDADTR